MLLVYYGKGKGKTTAAVGTVTRALGRGKRVVVIQFMKAWPTGEREFFRELIRKYPSMKDRLIWINFGTKEFINPNNLGDMVASINMAYAYGTLLYVIPNLVRSCNPDLLVLDELGVAIHLSIVDEYLPRNLLKMYKGNPDKHAIITGRYMPSTIISLADLVTRVDEVKHYFREIKKTIIGLDY